MYNTSPQNFVTKMTDQEVFLSLQETVNLLASQGGYWKVKILSWSDPDARDSVPSYDEKLFVSLELAKKALRQYVRTRSCEPVSQKAIFEKIETTDWSKEKQCLFLYNAHYLSITFEYPEVARKLIKDVSEVKDVECCHEYGSDWKEINMEHVKPSGDFGEVCRMLNKINVENIDIPYLLKKVFGKKNNMSFTSKNKLSILKEILNNINFMQESYSKTLLFSKIVLNMEEDGGEEDEKEDLYGNDLDEQQKIDEYDN